MKIVVSTLEVHGGGFKYVKGSRLQSDLINQYCKNLSLQITDYQELQVQN